MTIVQKMKKVCWWKKKSILIYLFMLEIVFFNRFQVIQGTGIKALLLQLFFSRLKLTTEEKMLMISLMCMTLGKQIMQIFIKHSRLYSILFFFYFPLCKWITYYEKEKNLDLLILSVIPLSSVKLTRGS